VEHLVSLAVAIGVMGERDDDFPLHRALGDAIQHSAFSLSLNVNVTWVATGQIAPDASAALSKYSGLWAAPGSVECVEGALEGIRFAREAGVPLFGTCGGFQHVVLEFAKNVLGFEDAAHEAYDPSASRLFLTALACAIKGRAMPVQLLAHSRALSAYGHASAVEEYYCSYGINPAYEEPLHQGGLRITGRDEGGEPRVVEIGDHPFYLATLFVPQTSSTPTTPHPLITAFVKAAAHR
jgi:CTP synthase (UTP-ammonia lyase)